MKILFIILDGLGDRPIKELGDKTPLEAAKTPNFDFLAKNGICGLIEPTYKGNYPTSKDSHLSLFGYDVKKRAMGRGVFEAIGIGIKLKKGDVALRANFATVARNMKIIDRRAGRIVDTSKLVKAISNITICGIKFLVKASVSHRAVVVMMGKGLSEEISDGDFQRAGVRAKKILPLAKTKQAKFTADVLNKFLEKVHLILEKHPLNEQRKRKGLLQANHLLLRQAGKLKPILSFEKKWKKNACCIAGGGLYKGIGVALGMELINIKGATGRANTALAEKFKIAKQKLKKYDFCFLHIKGTDNFSHDGDFIGKKKFIERIDKEAVVLKRGMPKGTIIVVTADHSTSCELKEHSPDPVPVLVYGNGKDKVARFSEKDCGKGGLGKIKSIAFLKKIVKMKK